LGLLYWASLLPPHVLIFRGMLRAIAARGARQAARGSGSCAAYFS
jgi:hypothetical protein